MALYISATRCPQNHKCPLILQCPTGAISQEGFGLPVIDQTKCIQCGKCVRKCGMAAIDHAEPVSATVQTQQ